MKFLTWNNENIAQIIHHEFNVTERQSLKWMSCSIDKEINISCGFTIYMERFTWCGKSNEKVAINALTTNLYQWSPTLKLYYWLFHRYACYTGTSPGRISHSQLHKVSHTFLLHTYHLALISNASYATEIQDTIICFYFVPFYRKTHCFNC